ncbi:MAG: SLC13/DASS family transporter [Oscillospiraceae bacterium]|nr:SLC13/DASS family transporter [Oscillospiraceae bacterium]
MSPAVLGLLILGLCVVLFLTNLLPLCVTGCLGCILMVLLGVVPFSTAFSGFGNSIVLLMASAMIVGIALFRTGVAQMIGRTAIRLAHGSERRFLFCSCLICAGLSMFCANTAIVATFIPIVNSVGESGGMKRRNLLLPITCATMIGGMSTLVGCTPQLTANAMLLELVGQQMGMWTLTAPAMGILVLYMTYLMLFGYRQGNRIWGDRTENSMESEESLTEDKTAGKGKKTVMCILLIGMIILYITEIIPVTQTAILTALLCLITGCCSVDDVRHKLHWETVVFLAACLGLAQSVTDGGSGELLSKGVQAVLGHITSPMAIFAIIVAFTLLLSQFITNSTAIVIAMPIGLSLCTAFGLAYMPFCVGITLAASIACCTPLAASQITMTQVAGYEFSDYVKYGVLPTLVMYTGILLFVPVCYPLVVS